jgi:hypothetical protein
MRCDTCPENQQPTNAEPQAPQQFFHQHISSQEEQRLTEELHQQTNPESPRDVANTAYSPTSPQLNENLFSPVEIVTQHDSAAIYAQKNVDQIQDNQHQNIEKKTVAQKNNELDSNDISKDSSPEWGQQSSLPQDFITMTTDEQKENSVEEKPQPTAEDILTETINQELQNLYLKGINKEAAITELKNKYATPLQKKISSKSYQELIDDFFQPYNFDIAQFAKTYISIQLALAQQQEYNQLQITLKTKKHNNVPSATTLDTIKDTVSQTGKTMANQLNSSSEAIKNELQQVHAKLFGNKEKQ